MADRPSGTVTFLFSDVEGSTRLLRALGAERYRSVLDAHRRIVRGAIASHRGEEVDVQGDAFFVAFHSAQDAVAAAADAQRMLAAHEWPDANDVRVRIGIHTTEAIATDEGYIGIGVHTGARICAAAHGGQVLLSQTASELVAEEHGIELIELGSFRLKDLAAPQQLHQLAIDGLPARFPRPRTLDNHPTNLPLQATQLIGRAREAAEVAALLEKDETRLVTLTGPGGAGKTRLALQVAADLVDDFPDGAFFVALAGVADPELVIPTIGQALSVSEAAGQSLSAFLGPKRLLLVLDNLEHIIGAAPAVAALLSQAPGVRAIATSQEPLHIGAEQVYPLAPMSLPNLARSPDAATALESEAVVLFAERARAVQPGFAVTDENAAAIAELCVRLDGLPLALELAAARTGLLSPEAILARLGQRLTLLTGGSRDQPARLQTLRNTLTWSHDLLTDAERGLLARLSVFAGGFTLVAAEQVGDADLDLLGSLVDRSLVQRQGDRFSMLEAVREFAAEQLDAAGHAEAIRERHAAYFEGLAVAAFDARMQRPKVATELEAELDNLRAALDWLSGTDAARYGRLVGRLGWFWHVHSHFAEGRARVERALSAASTEGEDRAQLLSAATELAGWHGDIAGAERVGAEAIAAWRDLGRETETGLVRYDLAWGHFFAGGDLAVARRLMEESLELSRSVADPWLINRSQLGLLQILVAVGDVQTVKQLGPEAVEVSRRLGDRWSEHFAEHFLADCALIEGDVAEAQRRYRLSLEAAWESGDQVETCYELQGMAMAAAGDRPEHALRIMSAATTKLAELGVEAAPTFWSELIERHIAAARRDLAEAEADTAWRAGTDLSLAGAVEEARSGEALDAPQGSV
ncbi:MAG TPA: adenylate/guanylate cyclase domain-containing protein [Candidatus Limnocylindria bacterium]